jgi:predicted nucleic acid-binding protein
LKLKRKTIEYKDLMIVPTALQVKYKSATINEKRFQDINGLDLITPSSFIE